MKTAVKLSARQGTAIRRLANARGMNSARINAHYLLQMVRYELRRRGEEWWDETDARLFREALADIQRVDAAHLLARAIGRGIWAGIRAVQIRRMNGDAPCLAKASGRLQNRDYRRSAHWADQEWLAEASAALETLLTALVKQPTP